MIKKIYKFGGASVKDADAVRNLKNIVAQHKDEDIFLVVSAMGKTTNMLEKALKDFRDHDGELGIEALSEVMSYHEKIILDLFDQNHEHPVIESVSSLFIELWEKLQNTDQPYDYQYDQTVSYGELISTTIIQEYLNHCDVPCRWLDARKYVLTDERFRAASPNWDETRLRISKLNDEHIHGIVCITQGFIGSTVDGKHSVTLGREGSDYTAAIFANCLDAEEVTIWKDVDGLLNADPKRFDETVQLPHITYSEAIELAFYGASIIHPKTLKPLQNKNITLKVQSFLNPDHAPSIIDGKADRSIGKVPSYIVKDNQTLVSISPRDYSFMNEHNLRLIFAACDELNIHSNVIQTSALMLSFCFDHDEEKLKGLVGSLRETFQVKYNKGLTLFTIRHYDNAYTMGDRFLEGRKVYLKQSSRSTLQYVVRSEE
ncbi:MAG: aspartate kinase [Bacteroidales bacterium]|nr:aspartate kinase [Bacteroidales bacterium]